MSQEFLESLFEVDGLNAEPDDSPIYTNATYMISFPPGRFNAMNHRTDCAKPSDKNDTSEALAHADGEPSADTVRSEAKTANEGAH